MLVHRVEHGAAEIMLFEQMTEAQHGLFSVNYSFALTTVISPYERHLPPSTADDIFVGLG
jgi:hypothetical protein